jgi:hypothetical protein
MTVDTVAARLIKGVRVRRWWAALVCAVALAVTSACGSLPYGIDGNLSDEWAPPPAPQPFKPADSGCFDTIKPNVALVDYAPFDCATRHVAESFFVGELTGTAAGNDANKTGAGASAAAAECSRRAVPFLGAEHRTGQLRVQPVLPGTAGWQSGARWFRCDAIQVDLDTDEVVSRTGSLRDALKGAAPLALRCFQPVVRGANVGQMKPVDCAKGHDAEFAGLWTAPDMKFEDLGGDSRMAKGCRSTIADWAKVPDNGDVQYRYGYLAFAPTRAEWDYGIRSVQCFLWIEGRKMTGSYRNAGTGKLPINYG